MRSITVRRFLVSLLPLFMSMAMFTDRASAQQVQCASQYGAGNIASQVQNSIFGGGGIVPIYQSQCFGQIGTGNSAAQLQTLGGLNLNLPSGNYNLPTVPGGQGLLQLGNNNFALQQSLNLILPPSSGLNISHSEANPTIINSNNNYNNLLGR